MKPIPPNHEPVLSRSEDTLCRGELVESLFEIIQNSDKNCSLTIGICGKWGSGKTTLINFLKDYAKIKCNQESDIVSDDVVFIDFNPWLYSSQEDLSVQLLKLLSYNLSSKFRRRLYNASSHIPFLLEIASVISIEPTVGRLMHSFAQLIRSNNDGIPLDALKKKISEMLGKPSCRYVVIIDDVDRLDPDEIRMIMKLVRSVADFSNVTYILCYDEDIVSNVLTTESYAGHDYLQKIVNLRVRLPEHSPYIAVDYLRNQYLAIVDKNELDDYETAVFEKFVKIELSLRDVQLIASKFQLLYDVSKHNTCPIDLLALTLIDTKYPKTYEWISSMRYRLCGDGTSNYFIAGLNEEKGNLETLFLEAGNDVSLTSLMGIIFPRFYETAWIFKSKMAYCIRNCRFVNNYFKLTPSSLGITDEMIEALIKNSSVEEFFSIVSGVDYNAVPKFIDLILEKISSDANYSEYLRQLSGCILEQSFSGGKIFRFELFKQLSRVVRKYLSTFSDNNERVTYIRSKCPQNGLHKIVFYGGIINRTIGYYCDGENAAVDGLFKEISNTICERFETETLEDPEEIMMALFLISSVSKKLAAQKYFEIKPNPEDREEFRESVRCIGYAVDLLAELEKVYS